MATLTNPPQSQSHSLQNSHPLDSYKAKPKGFIEFLGRTNFSFLEGASHPEEMVETAITLGYDGLGVIDLNGMYGVVRGFQTARTPSHFIASPQAKTNFKYFCGCELLMTDGSTIALYPMNKEGYRNLCRLITEGKRGSQKSFIKLSFALLEEFSEDLLAVPLPPWTDERLQQLLLFFKDRLHIPVWRDLTYESRVYYQQALWYEKHWQLQLFATQRPLMHSPDRKPLLDILTCILHHTTIDRAHDLLLANRERHLHPLEEFYHLWQDRPDLVEVTLAMADQLHFQLSELRYRYPQSELPEKMTPSDYLKSLTEKGLSFRYPQGAPENILKLIQHELSLIKELEYEDYFLTLYEICQFAKEKNILFQGRGSAANSVVCFVLGLTSVDPTQIDLLFERFISKERDEPPDIDIDFEHQRREEVIQHIYEKYGAHRAAMVATVIRFKTKMALRETAKVFGVKIEAINELIRFMGRDGFRRLEESPEEIKKRFPLDIDLIKKIVIMGKQLHGFPRHLGIHTGGFIITEDVLEELVPVEKATMNGRFVVQWNKDDVNNLGLMKIDVLSLGMLTAIRRALDLLRKHKGLDLNMAQIPQEDPVTYQMIQKADTIGVFQIESRAQMQTLPRMKPKTFYDLVIQVALIRPGPLQGGMVHPFLKRRAGLEKVNYAHPDLEPILRKTMGVPIFQEQIMRMVVAIAKFTPGEADELRRIMSSSWTLKNVMGGVREKVINGMLSHGLTKVYAEQVYQTIAGFAAYGFPESHSASFALLTYVSCWIKCHHPDVFACSLLNSQPMGFYPARTLIDDAKRKGVMLLPLDINKSNYDYTLEPKQKDCAEASTPLMSQLNLRQGLRSLFGVQEQHMRRIESERTQNGNFRNLSDFIKRCPLPRATLLKLAAASAFDFLDLNEDQGPLSARETLWHLASVNLDQSSFTYSEARNTFVDENLFEEESPWQSLEREYQAFGFSGKNHPMSFIRQKLISNRFLKTQELSNSQKLKTTTSQFTTVAGLVAMTQRPPTAKGFCFITLEDEWGLINVVIEPAVYQKFRMIIYSAGFIQVSGRIEKRSDVINIKAKEIKEIVL